MLELTGKCCSGMDAIEFMEMLPDVIDEDAKTEDFCQEYEAALNRFRYEVAKGIGTKKKIVKAKTKDTRILSTAESADLERENHHISTARTAEHDIYRRGL